MEICHHLKLVTTATPTHVCACSGQHTGSSVSFYHNQMIPATRGGPCRVRLSPSAAPLAAKQLYRIHTCIGDRPGICLDHPAQVVLFGDGAVPPEDLGEVLTAATGGVAGRAGPFDLEVPDTREQPFQRRAQNTFSVRVGRLQHALPDRNV